MPLATMYEFEILYTLLQLTLNANSSNNWNWNVGKINK